MNLNFASIWEEISDIIPERTAMVCGAEEKTWIEYDKAASKLASALNDSGLKTYSKAGLYPVSYTHLTLPTTPYV